MSKITDIYTNNKVSAKDIAMKLAEIDGYNVAIKDFEPTAKLYLPYISIRETEITKTDYGYEVKLTILACKEDFNLYRDTVKHIIQATSGKAIYEKDIEILNPVDFFNKKYIYDSMDSEFNSIYQIAKHEIKEKGDVEIAIFCPFSIFYIGKNIIQKLDNTINPFFSFKKHKLYELIRKSQYDNIEWYNFKVMEIENEEKNIKGTIITTNNKYPQIVTKEDFFGITDEDQIIMIKYEDLHKISPKSWDLIDECQYKAPILSHQEWNDFKEKVKTLSI